MHIYLIQLQSQLQQSVDSLHPRLNLAFKRMRPCEDWLVIGLLRPSHLEAHIRTCIYL